MILSFCIVLFFGVWGFVHVKNQGIDPTPSGLWTMGFGALNQNALVIYGAEAGSNPILMAIIANSGYYYVPHFVDSVENETIADSSFFTKYRTKHVTTHVSDSSYAAIHEGMHDVTIPRSQSPQTSHQTHNSLPHL